MQKMLLLKTSSVDGDLEVDNQSGRKHTDDGRFDQGDMMSH